MTEPTDAELLAEWDRVSHIADAGQRRLACLRAVLAKWGTLQAEKIVIPADKLKQAAQQAIATLYAWAPTAPAVKRMRREAISALDEAMAEPVAAQEPVDYCTDPNNCKRCKTMPAHRCRMEHAGIGKHPWDEQSHASQQAAPAAVAVPSDTFRGDTTCLVQSIIALLELDADGALVPHGIGGHARALLSAAASRLAAAPTTQPAPTTPQAGSQPAPMPNWLPFSKRMQIANRHGVKVTAEFNALVSDVIQTYLETHADRASHAPADSVTAPAGGWHPFPHYLQNPDGRLLRTSADLLERHGYTGCSTPLRRMADALLNEPTAATPPAQVADSVLEDAARWTTEQEHAIRQGHEIAASDGYFEARPQIDSNDRRKVFQAGFERGWDAARKQGENHD